MASACIGARSAIAAEWFACGAGSRGSCAKPAPPIRLSVTTPSARNAARASFPRLACPTCLDLRNTGLHIGFASCLNFQAFSPRIVLAERQKTYSGELPISCLYLSRIRYLRLISSSLGQTVIHEQPYEGVVQGIGCI